MGIPHPIPYQGSKRYLALQILHYFPPEVAKLIEPFAGSAAISLAAAASELSSFYHLNDLNEPLMQLWRSIITTPRAISRQYATLWKAQHKNSREYYDFVRNQFNKTGRPDYFLYLLARCVKSAVRYNSRGEFNQSPDNRRVGALPETMRNQILGASSLLKGKTICTSLDYKVVVQTARPVDLVYLDPPYQGVCRNGNSRYCQSVDYNEFVQVLELLNTRGINYLVSYDGRTGMKSHGKVLPLNLNLIRVEVKAGRSSQATLLGRSAIVYESLYLSPALVKRIESHALARTANHSLATTLAYGARL
jgi:DNA adenine methylase